MKKATALFCLLALLCGMFGGCAKEAEPLRVCVDLGPCGGEQASALAENFLFNARDLGGAEDVEVEAVPASGPERKSALTRIRTEVAAGRGPDLFLMRADGKSAEEDGQLLFRFPQQLMARNTFLRLDDYVERAEYMEWEKLEPVVMAAGRNEGGQYLLPLAYTFSAVVYKEGQVSERPDKNTTWWEMAQSADPLLRNGAVLTNSWTGNQITNILGPIGDYETEELLFRQDEMAQVFEAGLKLEGDAPAGLPEFYWADLGLCFDEAVEAGAPWEVEIVPLCGLDGGACALVTAYGAVNANTKRPEDAFRLLDVLLRKESQQFSDLYGALLGHQDIPVQQGLMTEEDPAQGWSMSGQNDQAFLKAKEALSSARFYTPLEEHLILGNARFSYAWTQGGDPAGEVAEAYRQMKMELAES